MNRGKTKESPADFKHSGAFYVNFRGPYNI